MNLPSLTVTNSLAVVRLLWEAGVRVGPEVCRCPQPENIRFIIKTRSAIVRCFAFILLLCCCDLIIFVRMKPFYIRRTAFASQKNPLSRASCLQRHITDTPLPFPGTHCPIRRCRSPMRIVTAAGRGRFRRFAGERSGVERVRLPCLATRGRATGHISQS